MVQLQPESRCNWQRRLSTWASPSTRPHKRRACLSRRSARRGGSVLRDVAAAFNDTVDYVYFRRFDDGRASHPLALVLDNSRRKMDEAALAAVHRRAWLTGIAPLLYVGWPTRVDVLSCARGADFWVDGEERYRPVNRSRPRASPRSSARCTGSRRTTTRTGRSGAPAKRRARLPS